MATREPRAVAVSVLKGGFGKTTTALNTARELAHRNGRALVVDLDDNGHLSLSLGFADAYAGETNHAEKVFIDGDDPREYIVNVVDGLDLFPAHHDLESVEKDLANATMGTTRVSKNLVEPLLGDVYDYIVLDCPANRGKLNDNAMYATGNLIIPLRPESGYDTGVDNTADRLVKEARKYFDLELLAVVPTDLGDALNKDCRDRDLLEHINDPARPYVHERVPNFARVTPDDWELIDTDYSGWREENDLPGIRERAEIDTDGLPLRDSSPECDQLECYSEMAFIVENGGVVRE